MSVAWGNAPPSIVVDLRTDFVPGVELVAVETRAAPAVGAELEPRRATALGGDDNLDGTRRRGARAPSKSVRGRPRERASGSPVCVGTGSPGGGGVQCRASTGLCDVAETCTGSSADCPADAFASGTQCRASTGVCDVAETCTGSSADCPADGFAPGGTPCAGANTFCDGRGSCCSFTCMGVTSCGSECGVCGGDFACACSCCGGILGQDCS